MRKFASPLKSSPLPPNDFALTLPLSPLVTIEFIFVFTLPAEFYGLNTAQFYEHDPNYTELTVVASIADEINYNWLPLVESYPSPIISIDGLTVIITQPDETGFYSGTLSITAMYGPTSIEISVNISPLT